MTIDSTVYSHIFLYYVFNFIFKRRVSDKMQRPIIIIEYPDSLEAKNFIPNSKYSVKHIYPAQFMYTKRYRNEIEMQEYAKFVHETPMMTNSDNERIDKASRELITVFDNEYPRNFLDSIRKSQCEFIIINYNPEFLALLKKAGFFIIFVIPEKDMVTEWIGRSFSRNHDFYKYIEKTMYDWDKTIEYFETNKDLFPPEQIFRFGKYDYIDDDFLEKVKTKFSE